MMELLITMTAIISVGAEYCKYQKFTPNHTFCKPPNKHCVILSKGVSAVDQREIIRVHNELRSKVALGLEKRGVSGQQPKAADMIQLEWDPALAEVAQKHAELCVFAHDCNDCRKVDGYSNVGQNLRVEMHSRELSKNWRKAITSWYDEVQHYDNKQVNSFAVPSGLKIGHFTQLVWGRTSRIGCGFAKYLSQKPGMRVEQLYTCNYGPSGNVLKTAVYFVGEPCTRCPGGTRCSIEFPGLCKRIP